MRHLVSGTALVLALATAACDTLGSDDGRTVEGVDFDRLFAAPTAAEVAAVEQEWAQRDVSVQGYREVAAVSDSVGRVPVRMRVVSHTVGGVQHYGAVLAPEGAVPGSLPVLVYLHGGDGGVTMDEVLFALNAVPGLAGQFVAVVPSFRGEPLHFDGRTYASGGPPSPWDRDVDDALALVNVALATTPAADAGRIAALGFSRGATVGMLMGVRDPRIRTVVAFFGPTDFLGAFSQEVTEQALKGELPALPGVGYLNQAFLQPLKQGTTGLEAVRQELIRRSPLHFARRLPRLQLHHGTADTVVPVSEAYALDAALKALGRGAPDYEFFVYEGGIHFPLSLPGSLERTVAFLGPLSSGGYARRFSAPYARPSRGWAIR